MRTVRFNVQMTTEDAQAMGSLMMKANSEDMTIHGKNYPPRTLLFRSHHRISSEAGLCVEEVVLGYLAEDFPDHKRQNFPVVDLRFLLEVMPVPNVALPEDDAGQGEVIECDPHGGEDEDIAPLSGVEVPDAETIGHLDAEFGNDTGEEESDEDGIGSEGAGHHREGVDPATDTEAIASNQPD